MKFLFYILVSFIFQNTFSQNKGVLELTKLNQGWLNSYHNRDKATLDKIFADDFVLISPKGTKMTKADIINNLDKQETVSINIDSVDVKLLTGDVGIITAYITFVLKDGDKNITGQNCYQDVYIKRKGRWFAVAAHVTLLGMK